MTSGPLKYNPPQDKNNLMENNGPFFTKRKNLKNTNAQIIYTLFQKAFKGPWHWKMFKHLIKIGSVQNC